MRHAPLHAILSPRPTSDRARGHETQARGHEMRARGHEGQARGHEV